MINSMDAILVVSVCIPGYLPTVNALVVSVFASLFQFKKMLSFIQIFHSFYNVTGIKRNT